MHCGDARLSFGTEGLNALQSRRSGDLAFFKGCNLGGRLCRILGCKLSRLLQRSQFRLSGKKFRLKLQPAGFMLRGLGLLLSDSLRSLHTFSVYARRFTTINFHALLNPG